MFIKKQPEYPRIGRLQYLAEHKIILKNTTPKNVINWFDQYPPVSGMGKLKLAEAYLQQNKTKALQLNDILKTVLHIQKKIINDIRNIIHKLPSDQYEVLKKRYYANMSFHEIAEECNISINTALGRTRYALINLRKIIKQEGVVLSVS